MFIDTHTHLYSRKFDNDRDAALRRAVDNEVEAFYLPNIDSGSIEAMLALEAAYPERCFAMMGLHPCSVREDSVEEELRTVRGWLDRRSFCAVGEIGIDLYWDKSTLDVQRLAFRQQIAWAKELERPIVIHSRESIDPIIEILREEADEKLRGIFHCFTGNEEQGRAIIELGFMLGIGGVITFKNAGLDRTMAGLPLESVVLETDSPYLAPVPHRGRRNESAYIPLIAKRLAEVKGVSLEEVAVRTSRNARHVFGPGEDHLPGTPTKSRETQDK